MILDKIKKPNDIKKIPVRYYRSLATEIRELIIQAVNKNGGHLSSNLGTVELIMALHLAYDLPKDKIIFDVGHQSYTHKILTGRANQMFSLRQNSGIAGFPAVEESDCDCFETGHATTSISAAYGMVKAREVLNQDYDVVAVIGDGAMTGGMAYEAINNASQLKSNMLIVLNDNEMSIDRNIGGMSKALTDIRMKGQYTDAKSAVKRFLGDVPVIGENTVKIMSKLKSSLKQLMLKGMIFENMGITYIGPIDGSDVSFMKKVFLEAKELQRCVLIHVITEKGRGYEPALKTPNRYHSVAPGFLNHKAKKTSLSYSDIVSHTLLEEAKENKKLVAITAAMASGTGLSEFALTYPNRFFDVGIAEEHALTMAAAMSKMGLHPVVAIYSTFLQRAYDQLINDAGGMNLPMTLILDRAGFVSGDGRTHQGIFDISYLATVPNLILLAPKNAEEFKGMLSYALKEDKIIAIRVPKGEAYSGLSEYKNNISELKSEIIFQTGMNKENSVLLVAVGIMVTEALKVRAKLMEEGILCSLMNPMVLHPVDAKGIFDFASKHSLTVSLEENIETGGFGQRLLADLYDLGFDREFVNISVENTAHPVADARTLRERVGIHCDGIVSKVLEKLSHGKRRR